MRRRLPSTAFLSVLLSVNVCSIIYILNNTADNNQELQIIQFEINEDKSLWEKESVENEDEHFKIGEKVIFDYSSHLPKGEICFFDSKSSLSKYSSD